MKIEQIETHNSLLFHRWQHSTKFRTARDVTHDNKGRRATKSMFLPVQSKFTEPTNIIEARKEMENIVNIQEEINDRKSQILYNLEKYKKDKQLIEETISIKVTNEQQREILKQICRIHEYQIKNVELESVNLMYEFLTRQKEIVTKRDVKRQKLVKEIVQLQKKLITGYIIFHSHIPVSVLQLYTHVAISRARYTFLCAPALHPCLRASATHCVPAAHSCPMS